MNMHKQYPGNKKNNENNDGHDKRIICGPLIRKVTTSKVLIWLVANAETEFTAAFTVASDAENQDTVHVEINDDNSRVIPLGKHCFMYLLDITFDQPLPQDTNIYYDIFYTDESGESAGIAQWASYLCYDNAPSPFFRIASTHRRLLHGSCRRPQHDGPDGMVRVDEYLSERINNTDEWPAWLLLTGDQIYADDVAGPMLSTIHALIAELGLFDEKLEGATVKDSQELYQCEHCYYKRDELLPDVKDKRNLRKRFFGGAKKPVFTSSNASNHLMTFAEIIAMYLLVWSPVPWNGLQAQKPKLDDKLSATYDEENDVIMSFAEGLPHCARVMAHLPTLMIFDDHDITDDWNLTTEWEQVAYGHPFSKRIIGNALIGYLLCQGWGNNPPVLNDSVDKVIALMKKTGENDGWIDAESQDKLIRHLLAFQGWEFNIDGDPKIIVLDTRTRRWRREKKPAKPSGLMNWEALTEFQHEMLDAKSIIIVSPAPMFGVKLIEVIQKMFTLAGKPLLVDAENWMAHRGAANVMLNIFRHTRTPGHYVILSGDVHYSFVYDIKIRQRESGPKIWQITSSGIKNAFPESLLNTFDRANRWLFSPRSPLNLFTKRFPLSINPRDPDKASAGERLWNGSGMGLVELDETGAPSRICQLDARGMEVDFPQTETHSEMKNKHNKLVKEDEDFALTSVIEKE